MPVHIPRGVDANLEADYARLCSSSHKQPVGRHDPGASFFPNLVRPTSAFCYGFGVYFV
jgi:hypothetical protein